MIRERLEPLTNHIFLLHGENKGRFPRAHSILVQAEETVLIDTGCGIPLLKAIKNEFDISYIINSHTHPDHSAGNWVFKGQKIFVPQEGFNTSGNIIALSHRFVGEERASIWQEFARTVMDLQNCPPTHSYTEDTPFQIGDIVLTPIFTPGHTMDHYCFYYKPQRILFAFDYDLTSFPWYGHQESSLTEFRQSIERLKALPTKIVVSSHRGIITENTQSEWNRYARRLDERNQYIMDLLDSPKTVAQLVDIAPIYRKFPYQESLLRYWEEIMIQLHLNELEKEGIVHKKGEQYHRI
jgi:glyoxylase-like metal-dependent hydrolase (beta-lactamase superfamily II)